MATPLTMRANGTIVRGRFVKIDPTDNNSVVACGANERPFGISDVAGRTAPIPDATADPAQAALAGENVNIKTLGEMCHIEAGSGGFTAGDTLKSAAGGLAVTALTTGSNPTGITQHVGAIAIETVVEGELGLCQIVLMSEARNT